MTFAESKIVATMLRPLPPTPPHPARSRYAPRPIMKVGYA